MITFSFFLFPVSSDKMKLWWMKSWKIYPTIYLIPFWLQTNFLTFLVFMLKLFCVASLFMLYKIVKAKATFFLVFEYGFERYRLLKWGIELVCLKLIVIPSVFGLNQICGVLAGMRWIKSVEYWHEWMNIHMLKVKGH